MTTDPKPRFQVTAAVTVRDDKILIARRPAGARHAGRWEFAGGKKEPGETLEACLIREIKEELDLSVRVEKYLLGVDHDDGDFALTLHAYLCRPEPGSDFRPDDCDRAWVTPEELTSYDLLPPDREIVRFLLAEGRWEPGSILIGMICGGC